MTLRRWLLVLSIACCVTTIACDMNGDEEEAPVASGTCPAVDLRCNGGQVERCLDGTWTVDEECEYGCTEGQCDEPSREEECEKGEYSCIDGSSYICKGEPLQWVLLDTCYEGCKWGRCLGMPEVVCEAGSRVCQTNSVMQCNEDGTEWTEVEVCSTVCSEGQCEGTQVVVRVTGSISMEVRFPEVVGAAIQLGVPQQIPMLGVTVAVVGSEGVIGQGYPDENGAFDIGVSRELQGDELLLFIAGLDAGERAVLAVVKPKSGGEPRALDAQLWSWSYPLEGQTNVGSLLITEESGSGAAWLLAVGASAMSSILGSDLLPQADRIMPLAMAWAPGVAWSCGACFGQVTQQLSGGLSFPSTIFIGGDADSSSAWGSAVILHEFGHYAAQYYSRDDSPGGYHAVGVPVAPPFAWSEGWATYFALSTYSRLVGEASPVYWDIQAGDSFWIDLASAATSEGAGFVVPDASAGMEQDLDENWVAMMIWDIWDGADVAEIYEDDGCTVGTDAVMAAVTGKRFLYGDRGASGADFVDFVDALLCDQPQLQQAVDATVTTYLGFPYDGNYTCEN